MLNALLSCLFSPQCVRTAANMVRVPLRASAATINAWAAAHTRVTSAAVWPAETSSMETLASISALLVTMSSEDGAVSALPFARFVKDTQRRFELL